MGENDEDPPKGISSRADGQQGRISAVTTIIRIASEKNEVRIASGKQYRRAVRCRMRRERPQKLRISGNEENPGVGGPTNVGPMSAYEYEPDIESFVSGCIRGVSSVAGANEGHGENIQSTEEPQRRTKLIRKRSLPLLSFLSSTHLAHAKKKLKKEEQKRQQVIAEEEAKKALMLNPIKPTTSDAISQIGEIEPSCYESTDRRVGLANTAASVHPTQNTAGGAKQSAVPSVTTTTENTSNLLMPPILKDFLNQLESRYR